MNNFNNPYMQQNPYFQQLQNIQQRMQQYEQPKPQMPQNQIVTVQNEDVAKNTQIPLDGSTTYFAFENKILARNWNIANGSIQNKMFILQDDTISQPENKDTLKTILDMLDEINKKVTPKNKKEIKDVE
ncbi:MAG: hypothetical protein MJ211_10135 [Bacteroidales bacterium]|nr:hypothetical protein [Bacteroidales bacterium]